MSGEQARRGVIPAAWAVTDHDSDCFPLIAGRLDLNFISGDEALKIVKEMLSQPKDVVDEFSKYIKFGE